MNKKLLLTLLLASSFCFAQEKEKTRTIDFTQTLKGYDGKVLTNGTPDGKPGGKATTLEDVSVNALLTPLPEDKGAPDAATKAFQRFKLAEKLHDGKAIALTAEQIAMLKERIAQVYGAAVVGPAWIILDPVAAEK